MGEGERVGRLSHVKLMIDQAVLASFEPYGLTACAGRFPKASLILFLCYRWRSTLARSSLSQATCFSVFARRCSQSVFSIAGDSSSPNLAMIENQAVVGFVLQNLLAHGSSR